MAKVTRLLISGLFGYMDKIIDFKKDEPTILTGPNGSGKTQTLRVLDSLVQLDVSSLSRLPVRDACVQFADGSELGVTLERTHNVLSEMILRARSRGETVASELPFETEDLRALERKQLESTRHLEPLFAGAYIDRRSGKRVSFDEAQELYQRKESLRDIRGSSALIALRDDPRVSEILRRAPEMRAVTIDTKRLDASIPWLEPHGTRQAGRNPDRIAASRIESYLAKISEQIDQARFRSIRANQSADSSFASRALDTAHATVSEADLRRTYTSLVDQSAALAINGLHFGAAPPPLPQNRMNPTEKRIIAVFLEDWQRRLHPLQPINQKIDLFRTILDSKLDQSFKATVPTEDGIGIGDSYGRALKMSQLSSGEQHLVALFTRLLFDAGPRTLVLVDEPEISLHAAWQHQFIDDLEKVSDLVDIQVVIATHSPSIVNGRWDLEVPLQPERPPQAVEQNLALEESDDPSARSEDVDA
jgi:ABC-type lipoprotein export system ATPase subunit